MSDSRVRLVQPDGHEEWRGLGCGEREQPLSLRCDPDVSVVHILSGVQGAPRVAAPRGALGADRAAGPLLASWVVSATSSRQSAPKRHYNHAKNKIAGRIMPFSASNA